ncbi:MAG: S41 family peptidase [Bacteroidales bacterium]|nr:S41 family peptidase [Bacteroidales bacterium]MCL2133857.1 S41 family peptidase [Bacteroidales bacterium]
MNKTNLFLRLLSLMLCIILGVFIGQRMSYNNRNVIYLDSGGASREHQKLNLILEQVRNNYVDTVNIDSLIEKSLPLIMGELDPHSIYIPASDMEEANESIEGNFDGIGVFFNMPNDTAMVSSVIGGGPAERAGVQPGDKIVTVNDTTIAGKKIDQDAVVKMLRGKTGTKVTIGVKRIEEPNLIQIPITRGKIPVKSVDVAFMLSEHTGYIKLSKFSKISHDEFVQAAQKLEKQGMRNLVFDLRGNTGGLLDQAFEIANEFLVKDCLIVYTEGRARRRQELHANGRGLFQQMNLAILIDESTASASEIVAGALQDNDKGYIVGRRSFGKGLVQEPVFFTDNSGIRLTVARYYTPTGRCIQKPYEGNHYEDNIIQRYLHGEFSEIDSIKQNTNERFTTPQGKVVYGGGGIMPDIFVPIDTTGVNNYLQTVSRRNLIFRYIIQFTEQHRKEINSITTFEALKKFYAPYNFVALFVEYAAKNGVKGSLAEIEECSELLEVYLKAYIGRNTPLDDEGAYPFFATIDNTLQEAAKALEGS